MEYRINELIKMFITGKYSDGKDLWQGEDEEHYACMYPKRPQDEPEIQTLVVALIIKRNYICFSNSARRNTWALNHFDKKIILVDELIENRGGLFQELHNKLIKQLGKRNQLKTWIYSRYPGNIYSIVSEEYSEVMKMVNNIGSQSEPNIGCIKRLIYGIKKLIRLDPKRFDVPGFRKELKYSYKRIHKECRVATVRKRLKDSANI